MHLLNLVLSALEEHRRSGQPVHLAHAARALDDMRQQVQRDTRHRRDVTLLKTAANDWLRHRDARLGAALAYYSVFSLGPLLLIVVSIAGLFFGEDAVRGALTTQFRSLLGPLGSQAIETMLKGAGSPASGP
jgi:uncharacterized BrkB/YihY/UPF0761 family membrane protein